MLFHDCFAEFQNEIGKQNCLQLYFFDGFSIFIPYENNSSKNVGFCEANYHGMMTDLYKIVSLKVKTWKLVTKQRLCKLNYCKTIEKMIMCKNASFEWLLISS